jgi:hypothetical protein
VYSDKLRYPKQETKAGGFYQLDYDVDQNPVEGLAPWIRAAMQPGGPISLSTNPEVASGWPLRYTLHCRPCGESYPMTNNRMLRLIAEAVEANAREIILLGRRANPHHS